MKKKTFRIINNTHRKRKSPFHIIPSGMSTMHGSCLALLPGYLGFHLQTAWSPSNSGKLLPILPLLEFLTKTCHVVLMGKICCGTNPIVFYPEEVNSKPTRVGQQKIEPTGWEKFRVWDRNLWTNASQWSHPSSLVCFENKTVITFSQLSKILQQ